MAFRHLSDLIQPHSYKVEITPSIDKLQFNGKVSIEASVKQKTQEIVLHARGLSIEKAQVGNNTLKTTYDEKTEELTLHLTKALTPDSPHTITIDYTGSIDQNAHGLYLSTYTDDNKEKKMLATQFESIHARMFMPCIDEPAAKATFQLTVTTDANLTVVSNTEPETETTTDRLKTTTFKETPVMSTYLLALIIGELDFIEKKTKHGVAVRTYAIPSQIKHAESSTAMAADVLDYYENYFEIPYPLPVLNQIALPDVEAGVGAMENWGCVTYRADSLLIDPDQTSRDMLTYNAVVIAHELAHQWFGNLVTMKWWDELWLNEGFAAFIEYLAIDHLKPEWDVWEEFLSNDFARARKKDAMNSTHAVRTAIHHPKEIAEVFDDITYRKGSSSIRMLWHYLGEENFRKGLSAYLKKHSYSNATSDDLWEALEKQSGKKVKKFMDAWTTIEGHPIISIDQTNQDLTLTQKRFSFSKATNTDTWPIPLTLGDEIKIMDTPTVSLPKDTSLLLNKDGGGFFRIAYTPEQVSEISNLAKFSDLDGISILSDVGEQVINGALSSTELLELQLTFADSKKSGVWDVMSANFGSILRTFSSDEIYDNLKNYGEQWVGNHYSSLKWEINENETHNDALLRLTILSLARMCNVGDARKQATQLFERIQNGESVHQDLRSMAYIQAIRNDEQKNYQWFVDAYNQTNHSEEERRLAGAMCSVKTNKLMDRSLEFMMSDDVRSQDGYVWLIYGLRNRHQKERVWEFIKDNWDWLYDTYGHSIALSSIVTSFGAAFAEDKYKDDISSFFKDKKTEGFARSIEKALEFIDFQSAWRKRDKKQVLEYFSPLE